MTLRKRNCFLVFLLSTLLAAIVLADLRYTAKNLQARPERPGLRIPELIPDRRHNPLFPSSGTSFPGLRRARLGETVQAGQPVLTIDSPGDGEAVSAYRQAEAADRDRTTDIFEYSAAAKKEVPAAENDLALALRGIPFSVFAAVGIVSVFGVAVMTGVLFIAEANRIRFETRENGSRRL